MGTFYCYGLSAFFLSFVCFNSTTTQQKPSPHTLQHSQPTQSSPPRLSSFSPSPHLPHPQHSSCVLLHLNAQNNTSLREHRSHIPNFQTYLTQASCLFSIFFCPGDLVQHCFPLGSSLWSLLTARSTGC